jgi:hypothetical protein
VTETSRRARILWAAMEGLGVLVLLVGLMMWLSGAFVKKVEPGPPVSVPQPTSPPSTEAARRKTFPLLIEQVGTIRDPGPRGR